MSEGRSYWVGFSRVAGIGPTRLKGLIDHFGGVEQAWRATQAELQASGLPSKEIQSLLRTRETLDLSAELARLEEAGFDALTWEDEGYPARLMEIVAPPPVLFQWGDMSAKDHWAVAVVGTRGVTSYGRSIVEEITYQLAASGVTIVSGLARGVDSLAHRAALKANGRTIAVLGSGLDHIYPPEHRGLAKEISAQGAVLSDYPLGTAPEARNFPPRNRLISGLSLAVVVIEAGERSGALITADFGAEQGRDVFAVPGEITSPKSRGTNRLIRDGAHPLLDVDDVLHALNLEAAVRREAVQRALPEDQTERLLLEALSADPVHIDELQARMGRPVSEITASLALLELKGYVRQVGGMRFVLARERDAGYSVE